MEHDTDNAEGNQVSHMFLARAERFNDLFSQNLAKLGTEGQCLEEALPKITLEVEQLKKMRDSLVSSLKETLQEVMMRESSKLQGSLAQSFLDTTDQGVKTQQNAVQESLKLYEEELIALKSSFEDYLDEEKQNFRKFSEDYHEGITKTFQQYSMEATVFKQEMDSVVSTLKKLLTLQKQRLTRKGILLCGVFCLASILTGGLLFYLYPQHVYNPDPNIARYIMMGKITRENYPKLSPKDQTMILEEMKKYLKP
jgi:hypothetical protein